MEQAKAAGKQAILIMRLGWSLGNIAALYKPRVWRHISINFYQNINYFLILSMECVIPALKSATPAQFSACKNHKINDISGKNHVSS
jgi:hypothetical protein